jgi:hypothetical protein
MKRRRPTWKPCECIMAHPAAARFTSTEGTGSHISESPRSQARHWQGAEFEAPFVAAAIGELLDFAA